MRDADTPLGFKAMRANGTMIRSFSEKGEAISFLKHPATQKRYPGMKIHAVIGDETGVHDEVIA